MIMKCPHCGFRARAHDSQRLDRLVHSDRYACSNVECGHTFVVQVRVAYTVTQSAMPDESLHLPIHPQGKPASPACSGSDQSHPDQLRLPEV